MLRGNKKFGDRTISQKRGIVQPQGINPHTPRGLPLQEPKLTARLSATKPNTSLMAIDSSRKSHTTRLLAHHSATQEEPQDSKAPEQAHAKMPNASTSITAQPCAAPSRTARTLPTGAPSWTHSTDAGTKRSMAAGNSCNSNPTSQLRVQSRSPCMGCGRRVPSAQSQLCAIFCRWAIA